MNYLEQWTKTLLSSPSVPLSRTVRVEGVRKAHLGPRIELARVEFLVEVADTFNATVEVPNLDAALGHHRFMEWAIFGFLDVVMLAEPYPIKNIHLTVVDAEVDPVSSSMRAFRLAGRDAGRNFLEKLRAP